MLQALRNNLKGWVAIVAVAIIGIPVLFFGIQDYFSTRVATYVAKVGEVEIQPEDFRERWFEYTREMRRIFRDTYDPSVIETPVARRQMLERMIDEQVLFDFASRTGVSVSDALLREEIAKIPAFQNDGVFDPMQYQLRLASNNLTPAAFEMRFRRELTSSFVPRKLSDSSIVPSVAVDRYLALDGQLRDFRFLWIAPVSAAESEPSEEALANWFALHRDRFRSEEEVELEYIELDAARVEPATDPNETTLRARYEAEKDRYVVPERRLASHLLVQVDANAPAEVVKEAQEKAARLAAEARTGGDFIALARAHSDDLGSRADGGDLGWIERGQMAASFESALFAMEPGSISEPIRTDEGFHVIQLREVRPGATRTFDEVREELLAEARANARLNAYNDLLGRMVDQVLDDPMDLEAAARIAGLTVRRIGPFARSGASGIAAIPAVQRVAFNELAIANRAISDPIEIGPNHVVFVRVVEHRPSTQRPLEEVREEVIAAVKAEEATRATQERARVLERRVWDGASLDELARELGVAVQVANGIGRRSLELDRSLADAVFEVARPGEGQTSRARLELADGRHVLIELLRVIDADPAAVDAVARRAARQQLTAAVGVEETRAFVAALRAAIKIDIAEERLR